MLGRPRRLALLAEASFTPGDAKTAVGVLRYRAAEVAAVIDSTRAGATAEQCVGAGGSIPVVADLASAAAIGADSLLIGIAPQGGDLPAAWRGVVTAALDRGWDVLSGLHAFLGDDPDLAARARARGATIHDVRRPPAERRVGRGLVARIATPVVLTVGSDCNVGKMTVALETRRDLEGRGIRAGFVATGQTGIFIAGRGVPVDAIPSDFVAGAVEAEVLDAAAGSDVVLVEGQGALFHPGYSGVTLGLLHGAAPSALLLCHQEGRARIRITGAEGAPIPPWPQLVQAYEAAAAWVRPAPVVGVALNTWGLAEAEAREACARAARLTRLPCTDPVRFGAGPLGDAIAAHAGLARPGDARLETTERTP